ncbi:MAG: hypothetical protein QXN36_07885 [Candidatus Bathyarchaeia archaeon]
MSQVTGKRFCDIYALLEASQEIFFGNIPGVNKMPIETVWVSNGSKENGVEKVYFSPTKRRGVDRRTLLWTKVMTKNGERQYQDVVGCGLPRTCRVCAVCRLYGGISTERRGTFISREEGQSDEDFINKIMDELDLPTSEKPLFKKLLGKVEGKNQIKLETLRGGIDSLLKGKSKEGVTKEEIDAKKGILENLRKSIELRIEEEKRPLSITSRIEYGGGVAIQPLPPEWKQRLSTSSAIESVEDVSTPFKKQYGQPSLLFPTYYHMFFVDEDEIGLAAYAFLNSLPRYGAGHPKGFNFHYNKFNEESEKTEPMIVIDEYLIPQGDRPVVSALINSVEEAIKDFRIKALNVKAGQYNDGKIESKHFIRYYGEKAYVRLKELSEKGFQKLQQSAQL